MKTVLVVDDSRTILAMISFTLEKLGYHVHTAPTAEDALTLAVKNHVDIVITDINMPGIGGVSLIERLRKSKRFAHTPIIVNSTLLNDNKLDELIDAWINKPLNPLKLASLIEQLTVEG